MPGPPPGEVGVPKPGPVPGVTGTLPEGPAPEPGNVPKVFCVLFTFPKGFMDAGEPKNAEPRSIWMSCCIGLFI